MYVCGPEVGRCKSLLPALEVGKNGVPEDEREMLFEPLDLLGKDDLMLIKRGCRSADSLHCSTIEEHVEKAGSTGFACVRDLHSARGRSSRERSLVPPKISAATF